MPRDGDMWIVNRPIFAAIRNLNGVEASEVLRRDKKMVQE